MILQRKNETVQCLPEFLTFWKQVGLKEALARCCKNKQQGGNVFNTFTVFTTLFTLVFQERNFWRCSTSDPDTLPFGRDTAYRFLNSPFHNWRGFLIRLAQKAIVFVAPLISKEERKVFVVDDSLYNKNRSKKLELLSNVYDHVEQRFVRGFRLLTLAFTDGISLIPLDFALLGSKKIICKANPNIDGRSHGAARRVEAVCEAPAVLLSMIDKYGNIIKAGSYIVFDSWFSFPSLIRELTGRCLHVTARLKKNNTRYLFRRNCHNALLTLEQLYKKLPRIPLCVRKRQQGQNSDIHGSICVSLPPDVDSAAIDVRIIFLKNKSSKNSQDWIAILTTDLELPEEEVVLMYAKRWKIEEFFKVAKSLLQLEHEFQGRSYDMLIAHSTLVCVRFIFLELERRKTLDIRTYGELFYCCCDELPELRLREAVALIFECMKAFLTMFSPDNKNIIDSCLKYFISALPSHLLHLLPVPGCVS